MPHRILDLHTSALFQHVCEGAAGLFLIAAAAWSWQDIPPIIAGAGGCVLLFQAVRGAWRWIEGRGEQRAERKAWRERVDKKLNKDE